MTNPVTPPPELVGQWQDESPETQIADHIQYLATRAAQWGSDQELEACCEWLHWQNLATHSELIPSLCAARRPEPPSLKEQAHDAYWVLRYGHGGDINETQKWNIIRRALETLDD